MEPEARLLGDRYALQELIASGGMGRVWRARDRLLNRQVAVKVLRSEFTGNPTFIARFRAEAQHAAALHHQNIATVFDYGEAEVGGERLAYLVMELVEGESLSELLRRERRLDVRRTLTVVRSTAAALAAAHAAGLVHRDVKPGNVLVGRDGTVKITDFGIAWSASSVPLTHTGQVIGTAHYLSPEQAQGAKATPASDVYALGAVAYECLAGRRPFEGENSVQIAVMQIRDHPDPLPADVPLAVRKLVEHAMAKNPADRFPDGAALRDAADAVIAGGATRGTGTAVMPLPASGVGPAPVAGGPGRRAWTAGRRMAAGALLAVLAVLGVGALIGGVLNGNASAPAGETTTEQTTDQPADQATEPAVETPQVIDLVAGDYVGRPVADVAAELTRLGLVPLSQPVPTADMADGRVTAVDPLSGLTAGSTVTVMFAVPPPAAPAPAPSEDDTAGEDETRGKANNGNGNGNGRGKGGND